jgi:hypothetical protein
LIHGISRIFELRQVGFFLEISMNNKCILEAVTFLGNQERDRNLYAIPGLDYVAHEDVIPYTVDIKNSNILIIKNVIVL